jgi:tripartite-type tricarboxylate transporter receptor subunit TctC
MKVSRLEFLQLVAGTAALPAVPRSALAQIPPVRLIVPFPAGGALDITARLIGRWLSERLGQQFIIESRPGVAGIKGNKERLPTFHRGNIMAAGRRQFLQFVEAAVAVILVTLSGHAGWGQGTKTIRLMVPYAAGGTTDILARMLAEQIGRAQGRTVLIEDRPGGSAVIATEAVSRAMPDGNTLLAVTSDFVITPHLRKLNYNPLISFEPICHLANSPNVIVVNSASPYRTLADLLNAARDKPGGLTVASTGPGGGQHIAVEMLKRAAKFDMTFVPYPGAAPAVNALLGEHVTAVFATLPNVSQHLEAGGLRALAVASRSRIGSLPELPTVAQSGYENYEADVWMGVVTPAKTPKETVSQLAGWFSAALQAPEIKLKLAAQGFYPVGTCGADFAAFLRKEYEEYGRAIREANIKAE